MNLWNGSEVFDKLKDEDELDSNLLKIIQLSMCCNSSASLSTRIVDDQGKESFTKNDGNKTELALLEFIASTKTKPK